MSLTKHSTLLEKWLEDVPNSNVTNIKKERKDFKDIFPSSTVTSLPLSTSSPSSSTQSIPQPSSSSLPSCQTPSVQHSGIAPQKTSTEDDDEKTKSIDSSSIKGIFGWETVNDVPLPVILRENEKLVAVKIVESKVIGRFSAFLPWNVFSCINIKSYYVTDNESRLLNDINISHCEYQYGYDPFSTKDVVVCLNDVMTLYKFLQTSKDIFTYGLSKSGFEWLGFINISGSHIVPFISKSTGKDSKGQRKYVPQSLVQLSVLLVKVEKCEMTEWDASYLRMLCVYAGLEHLQIQSNDTLCLLDDLKWDSSLCPLHIEECSPPISKVSNKYNVPKSISYPSAPPRSSATDDANWLIASQGTSSNALRSLHQITRVDVGGVGLRAINLKPYSNQQAVFVSDVVTKLFRGVSILTAHYILEKILQVKLYECTRLHEDAFLRSGVRPLQGDKLVGVEVLRKCLPQLRQIIMAGMPLNAHT